MESGEATDRWLLSGNRPVATESGHGNMSTCIRAAGIDVAVVFVGGGSSPAKRIPCRVAASHGAKRLPMARSASPWPRSGSPRAPWGELFPPLLFCQYGRQLRWVAVETHRLALVAIKRCWLMPTGRPFEMRKGPVAATGKWRYRPWLATGESGTCSIHAGSNQDPNCIGGALQDASL